MHANSAISSRKMFGIAVIAAFHVAFLAIINDGLNVKFTLPAITDFTVVPIAEVLKPERPPPALPKVDPSTTRFDVPIPQLPRTDAEQQTLQQQPKAQTLTGSGTTGEAAVETPDPAPTSAYADPRHPLTQPDYPMRSRTLQEEGKVRLRLHVLPNGRVDEALVVSSSGHARLDEAAIREALRRWRLMPATQAGQAIDSWIEVPVVFQLN